MNISFGSKLIIKSDNPERLNEIADTLKKKSASEKSAVLNGKPDELYILTGKDLSQYQEKRLKTVNQLNNSHCDELEKAYFHKVCLENTMKSSPVLDLNA